MDDFCAQHGQQYCLLDAHNLFVSATLEDELLLLDATPEQKASLQAQGQAFGLNLSPGRRLDSYSGGEQALLACLLLMTVLPQKTPRILLVHVLEALSAHNRARILNAFATAMPQTDLFVWTPAGPKILEPATHHSLATPEARVESHA